MFLLGELKETYVSFGREPTEDFVVDLRRAAADVLFSSQYDSLGQCSREFDNISCIRHLKQKHCYSKHQDDKTLFFCMRMLEFYDHKILIKL